MHGEIEISAAHPTLELNESNVRQLVERIISGEGKELRFLGIVLTDHATVHELNRDFLGHDYETDVISFVLDDESENVIDGEVYVDLDTAKERAEEFGASFEQESMRYIAHGLLHLAGYDDASDAERAQMRLLEDHYLTPNIP
ncbi:rRNA maturation RNase YbeY [soil metagenome]